MDPNDQLTETLAFMRLLWAVDHGLRSVSKRMQARLGVTGPQRLVLRIVGRCRNAAPSEIADFLHLDRGTLTGILDRLTARGFLWRRQHPSDGRRALIGLTRKGRQFNRATSGTVEACVRRALQGLPTEKVKAARDVLEALARELCDPSTNGVT